MKIIKALLSITLLSNIQALHAQSLDGSTQYPEFELLAEGLASNTYVLGEQAHSKWMIPYFFQTELNCGEASLFSKTVPCRVELRNAPTQEQNSFLENLSADKNSRSYFVTDLSPFVTGIKESYEFYNPDYLVEGSAPTGHGSLRISDRHSYQTFFLRVPKDELELVRAQFKMPEGLGSYHSAFTFKSRSYLEYLRVDLEETKMKKLQSALGTSMSYDEKERFITELLASATLSSNHLNDLEAENIAKLFIKKLAFDWNGDFLRKSIQDNSIFLIHESRSFDVRCSAHIFLASQAKPQIQCLRIRE